MGYTSTQHRSTAQENQAYIAGNMILTEASSAGYFSMKKYDIARLFSEVELCSNGKIILRNSDHDFAVFEARS